MWRLIAFAVLLAVSTTSNPVAAQSLSPGAALERLVAADQVKAEWFTLEFLAQVSTAQVEQLLRGQKTSLGAFRAIERHGNRFLVVFERGAAVTSIALDQEGRIAELLFRNPRARFSNLEQVVSMFQTLPGSVSLLVSENRHQRAALNPDNALAVGSALKLAVLLALQQQINLKRHSWTEVVRLRPEWKSLPSGELQNWPDDSALTLQTLATMMISISDNTATDVLINVVGRESVEAFAPRNRPFLTTREALVLKDPKNKDLLDRYRVGNEAARRAVLRDIKDRPLPSTDIFAGGQLAPDVEWFFSTRELCVLMQRVYRIPLMGTNPGPVVIDATDWKRIALKGGSEPGVLNLTTFVEGHDERTYCVAVTWNNNASLAGSRLVSLAGGVEGVPRSVEIPKSRSSTQRGESSF